MAGKLPAPGTIEIAPSILSADFGNLCSEIRDVLRADVKMIHVDIMDGHFVPNITIGPPVIKWIRKCSDVFMDLHLMITDPRQYAARFIEAGADNITFHIETVDDPAQFIRYLKSMGVTVGITLNPGTPVEAVLDTAPLCDMVLVMTVEPGFGGQEFMEDAARKCIVLREKLGGSVRIEVDGGINAETAPTAVSYGADILVAGHAIFAQPDRVKAIDQIRSAAANGKLK